MIYTDPAHSSGSSERAGYVAKSFNFLKTRALSQCRKWSKLLTYGAMYHAQCHYSNIWKSGDELSVNVL